MKHIFTVICSAGMAALAFLLEIMGGWDAGLGLLFLLMALDIVTGLVISALQPQRQDGLGLLQERPVSSWASPGKLLIIILVILGTALDGLLNSNVARLSVIGFYSANEAFSIIENAALAAASPSPGSCWTSWSCTGPARTSAPMTAIRTARSRPRHLRFARGWRG
ncbi:MAG: phage holin family protein [Christensenellales bacterium]